MMDTTYIFRMKDGTEQRITQPSRLRALHELRARGYEWINCYILIEESDSRVAHFFGPAALKGMGYDVTLTGEIP